MSSSGASPTPADRLVTACFNGDLPSAKAAVADGARVNEQRWLPAWQDAVPPLIPAVSMLHYDVVVWLLSLGADPNGDAVVVHGIWCTNIRILQLLIDAGADINRKSGGLPPLISAVSQCNREGNEDQLRLLLAQPSVDFTVTHVNITPLQYARDSRKPATTDLITQVVSGVTAATCTVITSLGSVGWRCCGWQMARRAALVRSRPARDIVRVLGSDACPTSLWVWCRSRLQSSVCGRWKLLTRRAWHGWCVAWLSPLPYERAVPVLVD